MSEGRRAPAVGILGATGAVGETLLRVLAERRFPIDELRLLASERSAGRLLPYAGREIDGGGGDPVVLRRARPGDLLRRRGALAGLRPGGRAGRGARGRQLVGLPSRPGGAAGRAGGEPRGGAAAPRADRQSELLDHAARPGALALHEAAGSSTSRCRRTRPFRHGPVGGRGARDRDPAGPRGRRGRAAPTRTRSRSTPPRRGVAGDDGSRTRRSSSSTNRGRSSACRTCA